MYINWPEHSRLKKKKTRHLTLAQPMGFATERSTYRSKSGQGLVLRSQGFHNRIANWPASLYITLSRSITVVIFYVLESDWFLKYFIFKNILKLFFYFLKIIFHIKTNGSRKNYFILLSYISLLNQSLTECL